MALSKANGSKKLEMISPERISTLLDRVVALSIEAGDAIMAVYDRPILKATPKKDKSPLTMADLVSHQTIMQGLDRFTPELPVLSEESETTPYETRREWAVFWMLDPLDGTREFLERNGEFTVNIALIEGESPILGVVYAPAIKKLYFGARGVGAFRQVNGSVEPIRVQPRPGGAMRVLVSRSHKSGEAELCTVRYGKCELIPMGSSLKFCLVAEGAADAYPRSGPTMEWDTAAAHCILELAGGYVTGDDGLPLRYNKPSLLNRGFIAAGFL
jgi:3'(2'), 5'-bisphosphate nucleotidase